MNKQPLFPEKPRTPISWRVRYRALRDFSMGAARLKKGEFWPKGNVYKTQAGAEKRVLNFPVDRIINDLWEPIIVPLYEEEPFYQDELEKE